MSSKSQFSNPPVSFGMRVGIVHSKEEPGEKLNIYRFNTALALKSHQLKQEFPDSVEIDQVSRDTFTQLAKWEGNHTTCDWDLLIGNVGDQGEMLPLFNAFHQRFPQVYLVIRDDWSTMTSVARKQLERMIQDNVIQNFFRTIETQANMLANILNQVKQRDV